MKYCGVCGRAREKNHKCNMATLNDGRIVHATRIDKRDADKEYVGNVLVKDRWIKDESFKDDK